MRDHQVGDRGDSSPNSLDTDFRHGDLVTAGMDVARNAGQARTMIANAPINSHLKDVLTGLADRSLSRGTTLHDELAQHFDATMEKIGRWYRHWTQGIAFALAVVFTVYVNANTLDLLHQLTAQPASRLELAKIQSNLSADPADHARAISNLKDLDAIITSDTLSGKTLRPEPPKIHSARFWAPDHHSGSLVWAPFWFDVLARISPKTSGADRPPSSVSVSRLPTACRKQCDGGELKSDRGVREAMSYVSHKASGCVPPDFGQHFPHAQICASMRDRPARNV